MKETRVKKAENKGLNHIQQLILQKLYMVLRAVATI